MTVAVNGFRTSPTDWEAARDLPPAQLPPLSAEQREVAGQLHIPEEIYARTAWAAARTTEKLLAKTERFARFLQKKGTSLEPALKIENVTLDTWNARYEVDARINGAPLPLRIVEELVDELLEGGKAEAEERLSRIMSLALDRGVVGESQRVCSVHHPE